VINAQPAGDGIRVRTAPARVRKWRPGGEVKRTPIRPPAQTTTAGMRGGRRWVSHVARGFRTGAGGILQIEPRREQASPDRDIREITAPETHESTMQESQTHVDQEIATSSRQTANPPSPPAARQTEPEMLINKLGWRVPFDVTISAQAMNDIKERKLRKRKGKQKTTLMNDGDKVWVWV